jgi:hypothetical protein
MKMISFNYNDGKTLSFHLDFVMRIYSHEKGIRIIFADGEEIFFPIDIDYFFAAVYTDSSDYKEYEIIDFDEPEYGIIDNMPEHHFFYRLVSSPTEMAVVIKLWLVRTPTIKKKFHS